MPANKSAPAPDKAVKKPKKKGRRGRLVAITVVLLLVAGIGYGAYWGVSTVRASYPQTTGSLKLAGLSAPVDVSRDANGIPQIYADTDEDLFRAQGFVQAQDRFWEMDVRRHMTAGRLSEMFGQSQVDTDAFLRTLGWHDVAQREYDTKLSPETKKYLQAYADGVNAYLKDHEARRSPWNTRRSGSRTTTSPGSGPRSTRWPGSRPWPGTCAATCRRRSTGPCSPAASARPRSTSCTRSTRPSGTSRSSRAARSTRPPRSSMPRPRRAATRSRRTAPARTRARHGQWRRERHRYG